jgi:hypothetical protein
MTVAEAYEAELVVLRRWEELTREALGFTPLSPGVLSSVRSRRPASPRRRGRRSMGAAVFGGWLCTDGSFSGSSMISRTRRTHSGG